MEENKQQEDPEMITTAGGYDAIERNGMFLRNSMSPFRLEHDGETYEEYKERRKLVQKFIKNQKKGTVKHQSLFYNPALNAVVTRTYIKPKEDGNKK